MPRGKKGSGKPKSKAGRKQRAVKSGVPAPTKENTVKPSEVTQQIAGAPLRALLDEALRIQKGAHNTNMAFGKKLEAAKYLNKQMFGVYKRIWKMDPKELRDWRDAFDHYWEVLDLTKRYEEAPPLFPIAEDPEQPTGETVQVAEPEGEGEPFPEDVEEEAFPEDSEEDLVEEEDAIPVQAAE
jgi:hypothetical protein